jgi:streptogramin lyase
MSLPKLGLLIFAATLAGSTTVGTLNVQIQEYEVPTPKSRPHDPALAPDGLLWYTGQGRTSWACSIRRLENLRNIL